MLHGTLELSAIIVAGAAGLAIGNGWLFPGTYSRLVSFQRGAKRGMKIVVGTGTHLYYGRFYRSIHYSSYRVEQLYPPWYHTRIIGVCRVLFYLLTL